jgi:hypothetical protein
MAVLRAGLACGLAAAAGELGAGLAAVSSDGSSSGSRETPASDALGAGPIAAPTATPIPSIPAASAAQMRAEGARPSLHLDACEASGAGTDGSSEALIGMSVWSAMIGALAGSRCPPLKGIDIK